jgi:hypothetical protein
VYNRVKSISDNIVYMYHDYTFMSTYATATQSYVRKAEDYFNIKNTAPIPYGCFIENIIQTKLINSNKFPLFMKQKTIINRTIL